MNQINHIFPFCFVVFRCLIQIRRHLLIAACWSYTNQMWVDSAKIFTCWIRWLLFDSCTLTGADVDSERWLSLISHIRPGDKGHNKMTWAPLAQHFPNSLYNTSPRRRQRMENGLRAHSEHQYAAAAATLARFHLRRGCVMRRGGWVVKVMRTWVMIRCWNCGETRWDLI